MDRSTNMDVIVEWLVRGHDAEEWQHFRRVEALSAMTAKAMDWEDEDIENLRLAALFHHVDELQIPESALSPSVANLLNAFYNRRMGPNHDMEWSTGRIAEGASIIALTDRFDRLTSNQNYRSALSDSSALDILIYDAETDTDVTVAQTFRRIYEGEPVIELAKAA